MCWTKRSKLFIVVCEEGNFSRWIGPSSSSSSSSPPPVIIITNKLANASKAHSNAGPARRCGALGVGDFGSGTAAAGMAITCKCLDQDLTL